jgi:hypothetical protein
MVSSRLLRCTPPVFRKVLVYSSLFLPGAQLQAKDAGAGLAWHVQGTWRLDGRVAPLRAGDAVEPASLLQPDEIAGDHSITILLPDGQRILYECFTVADCTRGFRVPSFIRKPDSFALDMLARIGANLARNQDTPSSEHRTVAPQTTRQEAVAVLEAGHPVQVTGRIADLPTGNYTYDLRPHNHDYSPQFRLTLEKTAPSVEFALPAPGLYDITITDALNMPRINLFLAAIQPSRSQTSSPSLKPEPPWKNGMRIPPAGPSTTCCAPIWHRWSRLQSIDYG